MCVLSVGDEEWRRSNERHVIEVGPARGGRVELTFILPVEHPSQPVGVAGTFNGWDWQRTPFRQDGEHVVASVQVAAGERHEFRYRGADGDWFNDDQASHYVGNEYDGCNCVVYTPRH